MSIAALLFFLLGSVGLTHIVVHGKIFDNIRAQIEKDRPKIGPLELHDIITCYQCAGMWVGMIFGMAMTPFWGISWSPLMILFYPGLLIIAGGATSYLAVLANQVTDWFEFNIGIPIFDDDETQTKPPGDQERSPE